MDAKDGVTASAADEKAAPDHAVTAVHDDDALAAAMGSATISAADSVGDEASLPGPDVTAKRDCDVDASAKPSGDGTTDDPALPDFEDAREHADDDAETPRDASDAREHADEPRNASDAREHADKPRSASDAGSQESIRDGEEYSAEDVLGNDEENCKETKEEDAPVPVDNDTNDPQYIPRRGRFYEHDDRMAYSTTSSEISESEYEDNSEENDNNRPPRRHRSGSKKRKPFPLSETTEQGSNNAVVDSTLSTKKVLAISKVVSKVDPSPNNANSEVLKKKGFGSKKSRNIDALDKWSHDMYDEREQAPKSKNELLASYGYDIREESEAPRARRHHKYGRASTSKYTRNWQDTKAYSSNSSEGQQLTKMKRGLNKNKSNPPTSDEYTSEYPALDKTKPSERTIVTENCELRQQSKSPVSQEKKIVATEPSKLQEPVLQNSTKFKPPVSNYNAHIDQQNGGSHFPSHTNKNNFNQISSGYPNGIEKGNYNHRDSSTTPSNFYHRQQSNDYGASNNFKPVHFNNTQGNPRFQHSSAPRNRHFQQNNISPQQYNRDRYFSKGSSPNQQNFDQSSHNNLNPITAGTGRTQHGHFNNRLYENNNSHIPVQSLPPMVRSSKRYSVQSRRELPDPVLNFSGISKLPQTQQQPPIPHQQQNGMVVQEQPQSTIQQIQSQQMQPSTQVLQQQATLQIHQQQPIQLQQYHRPIQQLHPHHSMVLDHNTGMMVMASPDPTMYHQLYAPPQYSSAVTPGPTPGGSVDDPNATAAASALQMLATQAAVYQPVPTGVASTPNTQPESFMTTYYQLQQPTQQQPPPRRINLAIPIVAPSESNQQQTPKSNASSTPPLPSTSTN